MTISLSRGMQRGAAHSTRAYSLVEVMLAVSIMGIIVFALYSVFNQTQRALRSNITQVDVMESGRAAMDMVQRDVSQMSACDQWRVAGLTNMAASYSGFRPVFQDLIGNGARRTNLLEDLFFLTRPDTLHYSAVLYRVLYASNGVGTLSRFSTNVTLPVGRSLAKGRDLFSVVVSQPPSNFVRIADGVLQFRIRAYDPDGQLLAYNLTNISANYLPYRLDAGGGVLQKTVNSNLIMRGEMSSPASLGPLDITRYAFLSNALPASVEVELGVLEPSALSQFSSFPAGSTLAPTFLSRHVGQLHLFRQRIAIPQSPPTRVASK